VTAPLRVLIVDNYDSFTWNLAHAVAAITGELPVVMRNDEKVEFGEFDAIIISPGPGHPGNARDFGVSADVIRDAKVPVLGVCLGHQGIALEFGGEVARTAPEHGTVSEIEHDGDALFEGIPGRFEAVRYHSLTVAEPLPAELRKIAWTPEGSVMALRHETRPLWGVQFHPESILSEHGLTLIRNFLKAAPAPKRARQAPRIQAFRGRFANEPYAFWLDSSRETRRDHRSFMGAGREIVSYRAAERELTISRDGLVERRNQTLFDYLDETLRANRVPPTVPFPGGYVGYFGYELRQDCGSPVSHQSPFPDAMLMRMDDVVRLEETSAPAGLTRSRLVPAARPRMLREEYFGRIHECLACLREGEAYELCLTNQIDLETDVPALDYYEALRQVNPAPYSAYLRFGDLEIACSSPECFLRLDPSGRVESRPIKGTLPRGRTEEEDELFRHMLETHPRYRAENLMITDLIRNDLGRVAQAGSVQVPALMQVESYATVHQLVSTITAQLRPGATAVDCLRAAFPGGSMTGAPRLRAMEILDRLEPAARGIYSGSIGYLGFDGSADLNIVIRTAVFQGGRVSIGTGGAVLAQSDAGAEWDETQLKAAALLRAFGVT